MTNQLTPTAKAVSLVTMSGNDPVTTSVAIANYLERDHHSVILLVRKHEQSLSFFKRVEFEILPFATCGGTQSREVAILNEQQATLLISFMSNTPKVVDFKIKLVKAFYDMRMKLEQERKQKVVTNNNEAFDLVMQNADENYRNTVIKGVHDYINSKENLAHSTITMESAYRNINSLYDKVESMKRCMSQFATLVSETDALKVKLFDEIDSALQRHYTNMRLLPGVKEKYEEFK